MNKASPKTILAFFLGAIIVAISIGHATLTVKWLMLLIVAAIGIILCIVSINTALKILFIYLGVEGAAKLLSNYNPVVHVGSDLLIVVLVLRVIVRAIINRTGIPKERPPFETLFILHFAWFILTWANPYQVSLLASIAAAKLYVTIVSLFFFGYYLTDSLSTAKSFMNPWMIAAAIQIITSLYQAAIGPSSVTSLGPLYVAGLKKYTSNFAFRPFGTGSQPGAPSISVYLVAPFIIYYIIYARTAFTKLFMYIFLLSATITLLVCQVRVSILRGILGAFFTFFLNLRFLGTLPSKTRLTILSATALLIGVFVVGIPFFLEKMHEANPDTIRAVGRSMTLFDFDDVSKARGGGLDRFITYASQAPFGSGLSRSGPATRVFSDPDRVDTFATTKSFFADNLFIQLVIDIGIPGFLIYTTLVALILLKGFRFLRSIRSVEIAIFYNVLYVSVSVILLASFSAEPILYNPEGSFFWFFSGMLMKLPTLDKAPLRR